jgi:hypothetical protein
MPPPTVEKYLDAFKWFTGLLTGVGVAVPAYTYFTSYSPPLLESASLLTAAISAATIIFAYYHEPRLREGEDAGRRLLVVARRALIAGLVLFVVYLALVRLCTVAAQITPESEVQRYQVGFWTFGWGLTEDGQFLMREHPGATPYELMDYGVAFTDDGPSKLWRLWTIYAAGLIMVAVFLFSFVLWVFGWSLLAKRRAMG